MNTRAFVLLEHLFDLCGDRPFVILDADEVRGDVVEAADLDASVDVLQSEGYIEVKYADKDEYCLGVTMQGKSLVQEVREERERRRQAVEAAARAEAERKEAERKEAERKEAERKEAERKEAERVEVESLPVAADEAPAVSDDVITGQASAMPVVPAEDETPIRPTLGAIEGKTVLYVWLAAFLGALLGGGIVGLVMYILHVTLH